MLHRFLAPLFGVIALLCASAASAQPPLAYQLTDSMGAKFQVGVYQCGLDICPISVSSDQFGNALSGTVGITNPANTALYIQGVSGGVPVITSFSTPQHVICDSGCSGGSGGGGAVFGPTAVGTAAANPPVLIGGTIDGTATGAVSVLKVASGVAFINCANCSGSGISVAFGSAIGSVGTPNGYKDASGNFQPILGDVTNGQWVSVKGTLPAFAATPTFNIGTAPTIAVTGTFFQSTQPVSIASPVAVTGTFFQATQPISAASLPLATNAATATNQASVIGTVIGGTAATNSQLAGGVFNSSPITVTNTQQAALQIDANGFLKVNVSAGGASGGTSSTFGASFPATGTSAGMSQGGLMVALTGTSGNLNVQCANCSGSGASAVDQATFTAGTSVLAPSGGVFNDGLTALSSGTQAMERLTSARGVHMNLRNSTGAELGIAAAPLQVSIANTGANATAMLVTGTGGTFPVTQATAANLNATVVGTGTFSVQLSGATNNINNITGTVSLPTGAATAALQPTNAAQGSATSGQTGPLMQAAVMTAAPTYTTAQTSPLNMTTGGALRVADASVVTALGSPFQAGGSIGNTTFAATQATAASLNATVVGTGTFAVQATLQASATTAIGKVDPNTIGLWGIAASTQNGTTPTNGHLMMGQFNTTPTTITTGNVSPFQMDNAGNLLVNIKAGASSGAVAQGSTTAGQTGGLIQGAVTTSAPGYTTAQTSPLSLTTAGALRTDASATTQPVAVASGAVASGAYAAGAMAAGAFATGAGVDGWDLTQGAQANAVCTTSTGTCSVVALIKYLNTQAATIASNTGAAIPAGTALIGKVGIDQTTPGTTNGVQVNAALPAGTNLLGKTGIDQTTPGTTNAVAPSTPVAAASFTPAQVSVAATATVIAAARTGAPGTGRASITVTNTTTTAIYLGGSGVTTSTGTLLPGIVGASATIQTTAAVYGIVATGTATVTEFETY